MITSFLTKRTEFSGEIDMAEKAGMFKQIQVIVEQIRIWIDGEKDLFEADKALEVSFVKREKSESEIFIQNILEKITEVLKRKIVRNSSETFVPSRFIVYLSYEKEKGLRKDERDYFERLLGRLMLEIAKDEAGNSLLSATEIKVFIKIDGHLSKDEISVKPTDNDLNIKDSWRAEEVVIPKVVEKKVVEKTESRQSLQSFSRRETLEDTGTIEDTDFLFKPLYRLEIWEKGKKINEFPILKTKITIGRDDKDCNANIKLKSDNLKIGRVHAGIEIEENGNIWVTSLSEIGNPTYVAGKALSIKIDNSKAIWSKGDEIVIYDFTLRLRFSD